MTMTPTEKDAMALAVLDKAAKQVSDWHPHGSEYQDEQATERFREKVREARAHLASRIADLEQALTFARQARDVAVHEMQQSDARATRAEAELAEANERSARHAAQYQHEFEAHSATIERAERAEAELAAVREGAERYRWLKERVATYDGLSLTVAKATGWSLEPWSGDNLDAAIDAARGGVK